MRTAADARRFLESLVLPAPRPYAEREPFAQRAVRELLERSLWPERSLRAVHIAGSKGKGTTALLIESILEAGGVRTGTYTSPHLERWTERFRIGGQEVEGARLAGVLARLEPHVEALRALDPDRPPTFFDTATAAALLLFTEARVDCAIVEAGIGGRLDATNVIVPAVSCLTGVELEHTDKLGTTLEAIAREKAGIVKPRVPVVIGRLPEAARAVVTARAKSLSAPLFELGCEFAVERLAGPDPLQRLRLTPGPGLAPIDASMAAPGRHHAEAAALATACVAELGLLEPEALARAVRAGLARAHLPARTEVLAHEPLTVVDCAHTEASARALSEVLEGLGVRAAHFVLSFSPGKRMAEVAGALAPLASAVTVTRAERTRSLAPEAVAAVLGGWPPARLADEPRRALAEARASLRRGEALCVAGSVYMAGLARRALRG